MVYRGREVMENSLSLRNVFGCESRVFVFSLYSGLFISLVFYFVYSYFSVSSFFFFDEELRDVRMFVVNFFFKERTFFCDSVRLVFVEYSRSVMELFYSVCYSNIYFFKEVVLEEVRSDMYYSVVEGFKFVVFSVRNVLYFFCDKVGKEEERFFSEDEIVLYFEFFSVFLNRKGLVSL